MSHLQRVAAKINWLIGYRLHLTAGHDLSKEHLGFKVSQRAIRLAEQRNRATRQLKTQLQIDYRNHAAWYRRTHKLSSTGK